MKTINLILTISMSLGLLSCNDVNAVNDLEMGYNSEIEQQITTYEFTTDTATLTEAEKQGLLLMREEEKLAGDLYASFYEKYNLRQFSNITRSESRHKDAVLQLLNYFGIPDPALSETGKFANQEIQAIYNKLLADGSTAEKALEVGAFVEEYDIADLRKLISETQNADIVKVYTNLLNGSYNHINAFTRSLAARNISYTPQIISVDELNEITK